VVISKDGSPAPDGKIILSFTKKGTAFNKIAPLTNGKFEIFVKEKGWEEVRGYYLPPKRIADAYSKKLRNPAL